VSSDCSISLAGPAVGSGGPGLATSTTGQSGAENTFALSVARLVESLPLSTPPGRNVAHFTRPDHRSGFCPASVGAGERSSVSRIRTALVTMSHPSREALCSLRTCVCLCG
jgi:hypothetical protein